MTQTARGKLLHRLADLVPEAAEHLVRVETIDGGKPLSETMSQAGSVPDFYCSYAGLLDKIESAVLPVDKSDMHVFTQTMPIGVVATVILWNAQMFLVAT